MQAAVDHLAKHPPAGRYKALPGYFPHPLHAENDIAKALERMIALKQKEPNRRLFIKWTVYNQDSERLSNLLAQAKGVGIEVEGLGDWSQVTPRLAGKPAHEIVRNAGIPVTNLVRNGAGHGDIRTNKLARQIRAQANRLAFVGYGLDNVRQSWMPEKLMQNVQFEVRVPKEIKPADIAGVYFAGKGSSELSREGTELPREQKWVKLNVVKDQPAHGQQSIFRGSRQLPQGFNHNGRAVVKLRDGRELWSTRKDGQPNEVFFTVDPRSSGRQRISIGGFKGALTPPSPPAL